MTYNHAKCFFENFRRHGSRRAVVVQVDGAQVRYTIRPRRCASFGARRWKIDTKLKIAKP